MSQILQGLREDAMKEADKLAGRPKEMIGDEVDAIDDVIPDECVALSAVYLQLDEKQKRQEDHAELMEQQHEDRIRAMHTQRTPQTLQQQPCGPR